MCLSARDRPPAKGLRQAGLVLQAKTDLSLAADVTQRREDDVGWPEHAGRYCCGPLRDEEQPGIRGTGEATFAREREHLDIGPATLRKLWPLEVCPQSPLKGRGIGCHATEPHFQISERPLGDAVDAASQPHLAMEVLFILAIPQPVRPAWRQRMPEMVAASRVHDVLEPHVCGFQGGSQSHRLLLPRPGSSRQSR